MEIALQRIRNDTDRIYDEYEAGCYASGMIDFLLVPMEEIKRIRRSDLSESLKEKLTHEKSLEDSIL